MIALDCFFFLCAFPCIFQEEEMRCDFVFFCFVYKHSTHHCKFDGDEVTLRHESPSNSVPNVFRQKRIGIVIIILAPRFMMQHRFISVQ